MKKFILFLLTLNIAFAQYSFKSYHLQNPERVTGYVDSCAKLWMKAYDPQYGGFWTNVDRTGNLYSAWGTSKNIMNQSRDAYGFVRAFQLTGNSEYLTYARYALSFMYKNGWDKTYGGWYNDIDKFGNPTSAGSVKTAFYQHYALLGPTTMYECTRDTLDWNWIMKGYNHNETRFWDAKPDVFGYYDRTNADGTNPSGKSFNATVDAITTHVIHLYLITGEQKYLTRLTDLCKNMKDRLAASVPQQKIGFVELYDSNWGVDNSLTRTIMGHVLKTAWCFARVYQINPDTTYLSTAKMLTDMVLQNGYDHQMGGPYKDYDRLTGQMMMYEQDTAKAWWQMEQAIVDGLTLGQLTGKTEYFQMADGTTDFYMRYFVDRVYGDVYENRLKYGGQVWSDNKGGGGKAAYHSIETGYYIYLYTKLLVKKEPATLFYSIASFGNDRQLKMNPISAPEGYYRIKEVKRNDTVYSNVDYANRILIIPAGVGGKFSVSYEVVGTSTVASNFQQPKNYGLKQNYPNPFNPITAISYRLSAISYINLKIYDALGREVATLFQGEQNAGEHTVVWDAKNFPSGVYYYTLSAQNSIETKRMVLIK